jgi:hypothetical protein
VTGVRLLIGVVVMGIAVPVAIFILLGLEDVSDLLTIAACTFLTWGAADLFATILERPRLRDRSPGKALREDWDRRSRE